MTQHGAHAADRPAAQSFWARIVPQTILGLASLLFFMSISAAFSGAALFAYYRFELDDTQQRVADVEGRTADQFEAAEQMLESSREDAIVEINDLLNELEQFAASGQTVDELIEGVKNSIFVVSTLDENGQPSVGTAFVLFSDSERSFLLTSYTTVRAATVSPGPDLTVGNGSGEINVELASWDAPRDLALLIAEDSPNLPPLTLADPSVTATGDRVFAVSAVGAQNASVVQGIIADVASNAVSHDAPIGPQYQGGPLLNAAGEVVAVDSRTYAPLGFAPDSVFFGVPIREACAEVVQCPTDLVG